MSSDERAYDLISMGRACLDLYANEIGVPFAEIKNFAAYVGGCPTNVVVGAQRLGLKTAMLAAVGAELYRLKVECAFCRPIP